MVNIRSVCRIGLQDLVEALMTYYGNRSPESIDKLHAYLALRTTLSALA